MCKNIYYKVFIALVAGILVVCLFSTPPLWQKNYRYVENPSHLFTQLPDKIELNSAVASELSMLEGIGKVKAERIIAYRTMHGGFSSLDELVQVDGISDSLLQKIKPYLYIIH